MKINTHVAQDMGTELETPVVTDNNTLASATEVDIGKTNTPDSALGQTMPTLETNTPVSPEETPVSPEETPVSPEETPVSGLVTNTPTGETNNTVSHLDIDMPINTQVVNTTIVSPASAIKHKRSFDANTPCIDLNVFTFIGAILINDSYEMKDIHSSKENYASFLHLFATCIVPTAQYKDAIFKNQSKFEKCFSEHDEAMCITIFDNNLSKWKMEAVYKLENMGTLVPKDLKAISLTKVQIKGIPNAKYTMRSSTDKATNLRSGWGHEGMKAFHDNMEKVTSFRKTDQFKTYKSYYIECVVDKAGGSRSKKQRKRRCTNDDSDTNRTNATLCENLFDKYYGMTEFAV
jgi:hypothetical protein